MGLSPSKPKDCYKNRVRIRVGPVLSLPRIHSKRSFNNFEGFLWDPCIPKARTHQLRLDNIVAFTNHFTECIKMNWWKNIRSFTFLKILKIICKAKKEGNHGKDVNMAYRYHVHRIVKKTNKNSDKIVLNGN